MELLSLITLNNTDDRSSLHERVSFVVMLMFRRNAHKWGVHLGSVYSHSIYDIIISDRDTKLTGHYTFVLFVCVSMLFYVLLE